MAILELVDAPRGVAPIVEEEPKRRGRRVRRRRKAPEHVHDHDHDHDHGHEELAAQEPTAEAEPVPEATRSEEGHEK